LSTGTNSSPKRRAAVSTPKPTSAMPLPIYAATAAWVNSPLLKPSMRLLSMPRLASIRSSSNRVPEPIWRLTKRTSGRTRSSSVNTLSGLPGRTNNPCARVAR
jgi:hypothetical protein